jgi:hypothetical protein
MFRKAFLSLVATAALGAGIIVMTPTAEAMRHHRHHSHITLGFFPFLGYPGYGYPTYYDDYNDYEDCRYRRVAVKIWNKSHTHRIIVHRKRWVCY